MGSSVAPASSSTTGSSELSTFDTAASGLGWASADSSDGAWFAVSASTDGSSSGDSSWGGSAAALGAVDAATGDDSADPSPSSLQTELKRLARSCSCSGFRTSLLAVSWSASNASSRISGSLVASSAPQWRNTCSTKVLPGKPNSVSMRVRKRPKALPSGGEEASFTATDVNS